MKAAMGFGLFLRVVCLCLVLCPTYGKKPNAALLYYKVKFSYDLPPKILENLQDQSKLVSLQNRPIQSIAALHFRAEKDISPMLAVLHSSGYYDAVIKNQLLKEPSGILEVHVNVKLGIQYKLESFNIINASSPGSATFEEENDIIKIITLKYLGLELGQPADATTILEAERRIVHHLRRKGYPLAKITDRKSIADRKLRDVKITLYVVPGPYAYFGGVCIEGLHRVNPEYAKYLINWHKCEPFDIGLIHQTQSNYFDTSLFSYVSITYPEDIHNGEKLPMHISVKEAKQRSFSIGVNYATIDGFGASLGWEHRNFRGLGQRLSFQANISKHFKDIAASYREPNLKKKGRFRTWKVESSTQSYKSFSAKSIALYRRFDRNVNRYFKESWGWTVENLRDETGYSRGHYTLLKAPIFFRWSTAGDPLNPVKGNEFNAGFTGTLDVAEPSLRYLKMRFSHSMYFPLSPSKNSMLALRTYFGSIIGAELMRIPASKRFYAGTEQFLRGYDYLTVSPLNSNNQPIGGKSMLIYNLELRFRSAENLGFVLFYDIGQVYPQSFINRHFHLIQSVGIGGRYFSILGPLSIDLAFPVNRRRGYENSLLKLYVSIGQTF